MLRVFSSFLTFQIWFFFFISSKLAEYKKDAVKSCIAQVQPFDQLKRNLLYFLHIQLSWTLGGPRRYVPFMDQLVSEPVFLVVVSGRSGAAICCHDLQTLIQGGDGHFKEQPLTVSYFYWKISPRVSTLIVLAVEEIHAD